MMEYLKSMKNLKTLSIPRLELLECVLLKNLYREVVSAIRKSTKINNNICWTDSEVALYWIKGKEKMWKPWVENHVVGIREVVDWDMWNNVPGVLNPADVPNVTCIKGK